ncbi:MAG: hypothetical protein C4329_15805 [Chitinophagaceae bacterium]
MKKVLLSLLFIAAFSGIASAQKGKANGANAHGKMVSTTAHQTTNSSTTTTSVNNGMGTTQKHKGWAKGKHKGWTKKSKTSVTTKM